MNARRDPATVGGMAEPTAERVEPPPSWPRERDTGEVSFDYTMRPYRAAGAGERLATVNLLYELLRASPSRLRYERLFDEVRSALGVNRTVWGAKLESGRVSFELYFYFRSLSSASSTPELRAFLPAPITPSQVYGALARAIAIDVPYPAHVPAVMMSVVKPSSAPTGRRTSRVLPVPGGP